MAVACHRWFAVGDRSFLSVDCLRVRTRGGRPLVRLSLVHRGVAAISNVPFKIAQE